MRKASPLHNVLSGLIIYETVILTKETKMKILLGGKLVTVSKEQIVGKKPIPGVPRDTDHGQNFPTKNVEPELLLEVEAEEDNGNEEKSKYEGYTVAELKKLLDSRNAEYGKSAKKADLVDLADELVEEIDTDIESI